jgi:homoserine dehydrogenase
VTFDLILVGFGNVARRLVSLLREQRATLLRDCGFTTRIVGIATKRHGQIFAPRGVKIASSAASSYVVSGLSRTSDVVCVFSRTSDVVSGFSRTSTSTLDFIRDVVKRSAPAAREGRLVVVETTTLDVVSGQPAVDHVRAALAGGAHVVTANKGPVAFAYRDLAQRAKRASRRFLFEGAVMDGVPIFNLVRETMPAVKIAAFRGVVNSTTNFILTAIEQGQPFDQALKKMQAAGIAEADPSLDVDGWDAAAKAAALANVLLGARLTPRSVERQGITPATGARAVNARRHGRRVKLVARAAREGSRITARVSPEELPEDDLLAGLEGQQNAIIFQTDLLGEIAIVQRGGGLTQTAYALLSDLAAIAGSTDRPHPRPRASRRPRP